MCVCCMQFERTLIIAEEGSYVSYLEGCTAPAYDSNQVRQGGWGAKGGRWSWGVGGGLVVSWAGGGGGVERCVGEGDLGFMGCWVCGSDRGVPHLKLHLGGCHLLLTTCPPHRLLPACPRSCMRPWLSCLLRPTPRSSTPLCKTGGWAGGRATPSHACAPAHTHKPHISARTHHHHHLTQHACPRQAFHIPTRWSPPPPGQVCW